jgi:hypothetical protein
MARYAIWERILSPSLAAAFLGILLGTILHVGPAAAQKTQITPTNVPVAPTPVLQVGDCWQFRNLNIKQGLRETIRCVVQVQRGGYVMKTAGRVNGLARYNRNLVWIESIGVDRTIRKPARSKQPDRMNFPLWPGKNWMDSYRAFDLKLGGYIEVNNLYIVEAVDQVDTPAGTFTAFRIKRLRTTSASRIVTEGLTWYAPAAHNFVQVWNDWPGGTKAVLSAFRLAGGRGGLKRPSSPPLSSSRMRASHILVKDEEVAREVLRRLKNGEDFEALARAFSTDPSKEFGGDIGTFKKGELMPALEESLRKLGIGEVGGPVRTEMGYHILRRTG